MLCSFCYTECDKLICTNCFDNSPMIISLHDVSYGYKLTKKQIELYYPTYVRRKNVNPITKTKKQDIKYLTSEIETIADELSKDLDEKNPKRKAYLKQKNIMDEIRLNNQKLDDTRNQVRHIVIELLEKYKMINSGMEKIINKLINDKCQDHNVNHFAIATVIVNTITGDTIPNY